MTVFVHQSEFEEKEQNVIAGIHRLVEPDSIDLESDLALIAVVGRGMRATRGTAGRIFSALAHAHVNVKMIDQGLSLIHISFTYGRTVSNNGSALGANSLPLSSIPIR